MAATTMARCRRYLIQLAQEYVEFRLPELKSIARMYDIKLSIPENSYSPHSPFLLIDVDSEECARRLLSRSILSKSLFELWGQGQTYRELEQDIGCIPKHLKEPFVNEDVRMCIRMETFNKNLSFPEKLEKIDHVMEMKTFGFRGNVSTSAPEQIFHLLEDYGRQAGHSPDQPERIYFGRWVADGQRSVIKKYHLQKRKYLGNTSMDAGLSLIMANMAEVKPDDFVFDPFVGTGSILVACAHFGGYVCGTDIDYKLVMGRGKASRHDQKWRSQATDNICASLGQYGLEHRYIDALVADSSQHGLWRHLNIFDAIITDPPYGVREPTERVGRKKAEMMEIPDHLKEGHIPCRVAYHISDVMRDLLNFAAKYLRHGGRLVYWLPVDREEYKPDHVPIHPCLQLVSNSEQAMTARIGRRLITMEKVKECTSDDILVTSHEHDHYKDGTFRDKYFHMLETSEKGRKGNDRGTDSSCVDCSTDDNSLSCHCKKQKTTVNGSKNS